MPPPRVPPSGPQAEMCKRNRMLGASPRPGQRPSGYTTRDLGEPDATPERLAPPPHAAPPLYPAARPLEPRSTGHAPCEHVFVDSQGSAYGRLSRAFRTGNLVLAEQAAQDSAPRSASPTPCPSSCFFAAARSGTNAPRHDGSVARFATECDRVRLDEVELAAAALRNALAVADSRPALASLESLPVSRRVRFSAQNPVDGCGEQRR